MRNSRDKGDILLVDIKEELYTKEKWYINTYNSLGSSWLIDSLEELNLPPKFRLANLSANAGYYERDAYEYFKDLEPKFYLGDLYAGRLADTSVGSSDNFIYLSSQGDARDVLLEDLDNKKVDIILDCKGALWYSLRLGRASKEDAISLLQKYRELLEDDGILLIDYYDYREWNLVAFWISGGNRKEHILPCFGENSTKKHLQDIFGKIFVRENCKELKLSQDEKHPLSKKMGTAVITVESIDRMIELLKTDKRIHIKYRNRRILHKINKLINVKRIFKNDCNN